MALDSNTVWGKDVADAIVAVGITAGTPITSSQLEQIWAAVKGEDRSQLTSKATTKSDGATLSHGAGAPASIVALPGTIL